MGNDINIFNNIFNSSENSDKNNSKIENSSNIEEQNSNNNINTLNEEKLFLIKGFKQHYILTIANLTNKNIILLGDSKIGKTSIFNTIFEKENISNNHDGNMDINISEQNYAYFEEKNFIIDGLEINVNIWDTPGEEEHKEANKHFIKDCIISYLCFHFKNPKSFDSIKNYYIKLVREINGKNAFIVLVGIKNEMFDDDDNSDQIPINMVKKFVGNNNILFYSISLSDSNSIRYLFNDSIKKYILLQSRLTFNRK